MTNEELFKKLRPIVMLATGVPECILADQAGPGSMPAPKGAYATITPRQSVSERGQANIVSRDVPGEALALIDVTLLDHFIVAGASVVSMAEQGLV